MSNIGKVIQDMRCLHGMTRKALSENICSDKYIYLIETGQRTPSSEMLNVIGDKLGVDLFCYCQFRDCIDPVKVYEIMNRLKFCQRTSYFEGISKVLEEAAELPDFQTEPILFELEINKLVYQFFSQQKYDEPIKGAKRLLERMGTEYGEHLCVVNLYILLSFCYISAGDLQNAKDMTAKAYEIVRPKYKIEKYSQHIVIVRVNLIIQHYLSRDFEQTIHEGEDLLEYQLAINSYEKIQYTFACLAFAYNRMGLREKALSYFKRAIHVLMTYERAYDAKFISSQEDFEDLAQDEGVSRELIQEFKAMYQ